MISFQLSFLQVALLLASSIFVLWLCFKTLYATSLRSGDVNDLAFSRIAISHAKDGVLVMDMAGIVQWVNPAYCTLLGRDASEMIGRHPQSFALLPEDTPEPAEINAFRFDPSAMTKVGFENFKNIRKDGTVFWNQVSTSFHTTTSGAQFAVSVCRDVTTSIEREKQLEETSRELAHTATHDTLTGVANRAALTMFLEGALARARSDRSQIGVLHIDLDKFKQINDRDGHAAGDAVLVAVAKRIKNHIRTTDLVARIGGDEFVVVCQGLHDIQDIQTIGTEMLRAVNGPVSWQDKQLSCQISIGAALSSIDTQDADALLIQSDFALYEAKRSGRGQLATYNKRLHDQFAETSVMAADLRRAVESNALNFHFQPIVDASTKTVHCIETIAYWRHPTKGPIEPAEFIPLLRSIGLLPKVDRQAASAALRLKSQLSALKENNTTVLFTASSESLADPSFIPDLADELTYHGREAGDCAIAIRETHDLRVSGKDNALAFAIDGLQEIGISTILDNFGRHHAGMVHLAKLDVKGVKLDGRLVETALENTAMRKVFATTVALCRELGLSVTADGVNTAEHATFLTALGCQSLQGDWIAHAMPEKALLNWISTTTDCPRPIASLSKGQLRA